MNSEKKDDVAIITAIVKYMLHMNNPQNSVNIYFPKTKLPHRNGWRTSFLVHMPTTWKRTSSFAWRHLGRKNLHYTHLINIQ